MESEKIQISSVAFQSHGFVQLPFEKDQFADFISSLLGKPESISKSWDDDFELTMDNVEQIYFSLDQRIKQQNKAKLVKFSAKIGYTDGSNNDFSDWTAFRSFNQVKNVASDSLYITWDYLVIFEDKTVPERQLIELVFNAKPGHMGFYYDEDMEMVRGLRIKVKHTARTWANDIENLISSHIAAITKKNSKILYFLANYSEHIKKIFVILIVLIATFGVYRYMINFMENLKQSFASISSTGPESAMKFILENNLVLGWQPIFAKAGIYLCISIIIAILFSAWFESSIIYRRPNFILFTKKSIENKAKYEKSRLRQKISLVGSIVFGIATGIIDNWIFERFF